MWGLCPLGGVCIPLLRGSPRSGDVWGPKQKAPDKVGSRKGAQEPGQSFFYLLGISNDIISVFEPFNMTKRINVSLGVNNIQKGAFVFGPKRVPGPKVFKPVFPNLRFGKKVVDWVICVSFH